MMTGKLVSDGLKISQQRVGLALRKVNPNYHHKRTSGALQLISPVSYSADYSGHKLHIDQNEKMVMYGVTHICAIDGFSRKVVGFVTMPVKNNLEIYEHLYRYSIIIVYYIDNHFALNLVSISFNRSILCEFGIWDQIRVDHGREWYLLLYGQELLADKRFNTARSPHVQSTSKQVSAATVTTISID